MDAERAGKKTTVDLNFGLMKNGDEKIAEERIANPETMISVFRYFNRKVMIENPFCAKEGCSMKRVFEETQRPNFFGCAHAQNKGN
jgi:hypothetical protein